MLSIEEVRQSLIFDFEGEGTAAGPTLPPKPHMVGCFEPNPTGRSGKYHWVSFRENWKPAINGSKKEAKFENFSSFFLEQAIRVKNQEGRLIHWSHHENQILKTYLTKKEFTEIQPLLFNARIPAKRYLKMTQKTNSKGKSLEQFFEVMYRKRHPYPPLTIGAAESCRRIDAACKKNKRWKTFRERQKNYVHDLIAYNEGDCRSTWLIAKKLANSSYV